MSCFWSAGTALAILELLNGDHAYFAVLQRNRIVRMHAPVQRIEPVGGEFLITRQPESETARDNAAAKRSDQVRQERRAALRLVALALCHRASDGRDACCNSIRIHRACATGLRRSRRISDQDTHAGSFRSAVRQTDAKPEHMGPT